MTVAFRVGVLISGEGSNLQAILDSQHGRDGVEVVGVASSRAGARGLERGRQAGIDAQVFDRAAYPDRDARDAALGDWLDDCDVDLVVLAGFMELLGAGFVSRFRGRLINVHPSLLPAFPGVRAIEQALAYGVRVTGVTVHFVDEGTDTGPVILQESIEVAYPADIAATRERLHQVEHELLPRAIRLLARGAVGLDPGHPRSVLVQEEADVGN